MSVPSEIVNQSLFTAALFLLFISIPKLVYLTISYLMRYYIFRNSGQLTKKYVGRIITQPDMIQGLRKLAEDPAQRVTQELNEWVNFTKDIRDPIIEALVSLFIIWWVYPAFPEISAWLIVASIIIIVVLSSIILLRYTIGDINRLPIIKRDDG